MGDIYHYTSWKSNIAQKPKQSIMGKVWKTNVETKCMIWFLNQNGQLCHSNDYVSPIFQSLKKTSLKSNSPNLTAALSTRP